VLSIVTYLFSSKGTLRRRKGSDCGCWASEIGKFLSNPDSTSLKWDLPRTASLIGPIKSRSPVGPAFLGRKNVRNHVSRVERGRRARAESPDRRGDWAAEGRKKKFSPKRRNAGKGARKWSDLRWGEAFEGEGSRRFTPNGGGVYPGGCGLFTPG